MPIQKHPFERGGSTRIEISWGVAWRNFTVRFDGKEVGTIEGGMQAIKQGRTFALPDGSELAIKLVSKIGQLPDLQVTRNGILLPGTGADPEIKLRMSYQLIYVIGGLNIILGIITALGKIALLQSIGFGWTSVLFGCIYLILGHFVSQRSKTALFIVLALFVLDGILGVLSIAASGMTPPYGGIFARVAFFYFIAQGWNAISEMNHQ